MSKFMSMPKLLWSFAAACFAMQSAPSFAKMQVLGPYSTKIQKVVIPAHSKSAFLLVDYHELHACSGDFNYKQSKIDANSWYIEISPFSDKGAECSNPGLVKSASFIDLNKALGSGARKPLTIWINDQIERPEARSVQVFDASENEMPLKLSSESLDFYLFRLYGEANLDFNADLNVQTLCPGAKFSAHNLSFSYGDGVIYPSDNHLLLFPDTLQCGETFSSKKISLPFLAVDPEVGTAAFKSIGLYVFKGMSGQILNKVTLTVKQEDI